MLSTFKPFVIYHSITVIVLTQMPTQGTTGLVSFCSSARMEYDARGADRAIY